MTIAQKIFLFVTGTYLLVKFVFGFAIYIITVKVQERGIEHKKRREIVLETRRMKNQELYRRQYRDLEERKREYDVV